MNPVTQTDRSKTDRGAQLMRAAPVSASAQSAASSADALAPSSLRYSNGVPSSNSAINTFQQ